MISLSSAVKKLLSSVTILDQTLRDETTARMNDKVAISNEIDQKVKQTINHIDAKIGVAGGIVPLGDDGKIPSQYVPGSVDEIKTYASSSAFPRPGLKSVVYVDASTGDSYRWGGESYISMNTQTSVSERALRADRLGKPRRINGVEFDGSKDITVYDSTKISRYGDVMEGNLQVKTLNGQAVGLKNGWNTIPNVTNTGEQNIGKQLTFNTTDNKNGDAKQVRITAMDDGSLTINKINGALNGVAKDADHAVEADHAKDSTTWKGYTNGIETEQNTDSADNTWIPVVDNKTVKHTTKKKLKVGKSEIADVSLTSYGRYTGNGGQQPPSYFGRERAGFLMSNQNINGHTAYKNWLYMDNYSGNDVGGASAIGVARDSCRAFIMNNNNADRKAWTGMAELISTSNYKNYMPTKTGEGASGTWNININGTAANANKLGGLPLSGVGSGSPWNTVPRINSDGVMEVGKYIDFHTVSGDSKDYSARFTAETDGTVSVGTINGTLKGDITGFGQPRFDNGKWYIVGDDAYIGDFNHGGLFGVKGANGVSGIGIAKHNSDTDYATITYDGGNLNFNKKLGANISGNADGTANRATNDGAGRNIQNGYLYRNNGAISNLNNVWTEGIYTYNKGASGNPTDGWGRLIVLNQNFNDTKGWVEQIAYDTNGNVYKRQSINNATWSAWKTFAYVDSKVANATHADSASSVAWNNVSGKPSLMGTGGGGFSGNVTAPQFYTPNWFRAQGDGGLYWEKHGGGWYMTDSTWIRAYNSKSVYTPAKMQADGGFWGYLHGTADGSVQVNNQGNWTCSNTKEPGGIRLYQSYSNGWPTSYGNVISVGGSGGGQLYLGWSGTTNAVERIWYRNRRDCASTWSPWKALAFTDDKPSYAGRADSAGRADGASYADVAKLIGKDGGTGGGMNFHWSGQGGQPSWLWGGNDGTNMYVYNPSNFSVNYANSAGSAGRASGANYADVAKLIGKDGGTGGGMNFHWNGQGGQPTWLWGGNDGTNMYVYNPANFSVSYARSAGSVAWNNISGRPGSIVRATGWDGSTLSLASV